MNTRYSGPYEIVREAGKNVYVIAENGKIHKEKHHAKDFKKCSAVQKKKTTESAEPPTAPQPIKKKPGRPRKIRQQPSASMKEQSDEIIEVTQDIRAHAT